MPYPSSRAAVVEAFHLSFLEVLRSLLSPSSYVLKGGANLRYYFHSVRYSEDIDLDAVGIEGWRLEDKVEATLHSPALSLMLRPTGLAVAPDTLSAPKRAGTTHRWKLGIAAPGFREPVRTKIEFSARTGDGDTRFKLEAVPAAISAPYGLRPPTVQHYLIEPAIKQKVLALAGRSETQARDVFDLDLLLRRSPAALRELPAAKLEAAAARGLDLTFDAFANQVAPFLADQAAAVYDEIAWEQMQRYVIDALLAEAGRAAG